MNAETLSQAIIGRTIHEFCLVAEDIRITPDADGMPDSLSRGLRQTFRYLREAVSRHPARGRDNIPLNRYIEQFQQVSITGDFETLWITGKLTPFAEDLWPWPSVAPAMPESLAASGAILTTVHALARRLVSDSTLRRWLRQPIDLSSDAAILYAVQFQSLPELAAVIDFQFPDPETETFSLPLAE